MDNIQESSPVDCLTDVTFLADLERKRKNWIDATRENGFHEGLKKLLSELYPDDAHFLYELLQNAEDAGATEVRFQLNRECLRCIHNGRDFTREDVHGITGIADSFKKTEPNTIGKFGVGFKAVFSYTEAPRIDCDSFHFTIHDLVCPCEEEKETGRHLSGYTCFTFPFDKKEKPAERAFEEIAEGLNRFSAATILFLQNIGVIRWEIEGQPLSEISASEREFICRITRQSIGEGETGEVKTTTDWLRLQEPAEGAPELNVGIAFKLESNDEEKTKDLYATRDGEFGDYWKVVPFNKAKLCIYFPADKETTNLRFHINAPFAATIGRDSIPYHSEENRRLRDQLVRLLQKSLPQLRDAGLLDDGFLAALPGSYGELEEFYAPFVTGLKNAFQMQPLLPTRGGEFHTSTGLYTPARSEFTDVLSDADLRFLSDSPDACWAKLPFDSRARYFLRHVLEIPEWGPEALIDAIRARWNSTVAPDSPAGKMLLDRDPHWLRQFYRLVAQCKRQDLYVEHCAIIRGDDGRLHMPREIFLAPEGLENRDFSGLQLVDPPLVVDTSDGKKSMSDVLFDIGVQRANEQAVVKATLNRHYRDSDTEIPDKEHLRHMRMFVEYWKDHRHDVVLFKSKAVFRTAADDGFHKADDVILDAVDWKTGVRPLLHSSRLQRLPWPGYVDAGIQIQEFVKALEGRADLGIERLKTVEYNPDLHVFVTRGTNATQIDYVLPTALFPRMGVYKRLASVRSDNFDPTLPDECEWSQDKAKYVWTMMNRADEGIFKAQYGKTRPRSADSTLINFLREYAWLPDRRGAFHRPCDLDENTLHPDFKVQDRNGWLKKVEFGTLPEDGNAAEEENWEKVERAIRRKTGKDYSELLEAFEFQQRLKEAGLTTEELRELADERKRASEAATPSSIAPNPERRMEKSAERAEEAPKKEYVARERSVRVNQPTTRTDRRTYLGQQYRTEDDEIFCQLCWEPLRTCSFAMRNGEPYFEAVEAFSTSGKDFTENSLLLCPLCAAKYKVLIKNDENHGHPKSIRETLLSTDPRTVDESQLRIPLDLNGSPAELRFVQRHWIDLRAAIGSEVEEPV